MDTASPEVGIAPEASVGFDQVAEGAAESVQAPEYAFVTNDGTGVTLEEAQNGYLRQSDYTRKTQALAAEQQRLQQAEALWNLLQEDPAGTLSFLQDNLVIEEPAEPELLSPEETRWREVESFMQQQREREAAQEVATEIGRLQAQYGQFDGQALVQHAMDNGILNLEAALVHQRALAGQQAVAAQQQQVTDAKRNLPPTAGGSVAAGSTTQSTRTGPPRSVKEALAESLREAGLSEMPPIDYI